MVTAILFESSTSFRNFTLFTHSNSCKRKFLYILVHYPLHVCNTTQLHLYTVYSYCMSMYNLHKKVHFFKSFFISLNCIVANSNSQQLVLYAFLQYANKKIKRMEYFETILINLLFFFSFILFTLRNFQHTVDSFSIFSVN